MTNKIKFAVENVEVIDSNRDSNFAVISLDFFASGPNLHNMYISESTLMRTANTIKNCPLIWAYDSTLDDAGSHDPAEVPCGFVPETSSVTSRILPDGRTMLSTLAYVWKRYTGELLSFFKRDGGKKPVSVEMVVYNTRKMPNDKLELTDFRYEGITILGSFVTPAIPLAQASVVSFAEIKDKYMEDLENEFPTRYIDLSTSKLIEKSAKYVEKENNMSEETMQETLGLSEPEKEEKVMEEEKVSEVEMAEAKEEQVKELSAPEQPVIEETMAKEEEEDKKDDKEDKEDEEETFEQPVAEDMSAKISELTEIIERMSAEVEAYKIENEELKKFKANIEESQKAFAIEQTIRELEEKVIIPEEQKSEMLADAEKYSYSDIEAWKTLCKAKSFDFVARESKDSNVVKKAALPFGNVSAKSKNDLWQ